MKALTICQPYAELIMLGEKPIENRGWFTEHRGPLLIHAGKSREWLDSYAPLPAEMDFGAIVGIAELVGCPNVRYIRAARPGTRWHHLRSNPHAEGLFCWVLENVRRFEQPIPYAGRQGLFHIWRDALVIAAGLVEPYELPAGPRPPRCRVCGCTEHAPCPEGCWWVEPNLCSACDAGGEP